MNIEIQRDFWKSPWFLAALLSVVLAVWSLGSVVGMNRQKRQARVEMNDARETHQMMERLEPFLTQFAQIDGIAAGQEFSGLASTRESARKAGILERQIERLDSPKIKTLKSGDVLHRETYKLKSVRIAQVARFIDIVEGNYLNVSCYDLSMANLKMADKKDRWDVSIYLAYLTK